MTADTLHQDMYLYDIYSEYLTKVKSYSLNSNINSLSIRYYKTDMTTTQGIDMDLNMISINAYAKSYNIYDFTPVLDSQPFNYTIQNEENNQGVIRKTQGVITILAVEEPLPGDIFNFYATGGTNEFFHVQDVNFVQSTKDLNIYQLTFETVHITMSIMETLNINMHFYYLKEFHQFFDSSLYDLYNNLILNRNTYIDTINKYYNYQKCYYNDPVMTQNQTNLVNSTLMFLNQLVRLKIKPILNYSVLWQSNNTAPIAGIIGNNNTSVAIQDLDCYIVVPLTMATVDDPNYDPTANLVSIELMITVKQLQDIYFSFINYSPIQNSGTERVDVTNIVTHEIQPTTVQYDLTSSVLTL